jgi:S1-C subfamily serine protease
MMKPYPCAPKARASILAMIFVLLGGCTASTQIFRNDKADVKPKNYHDYKEVYFIPPKEDPRHIVPRVVDEFKGLGFNVTVVDPEKPIEGAQGTGFVITNDGQVLTCAHVIGNKNDATVWLSGVRYEADVVAKDAKADLAILKLRNATGLQVNPAPFRADKGYGMGEDVFTIGYPMSNLLGSGSRMSKGLLSSTTGMKDDPTQIQISAEIQPGSSGGPLFDKNGVVIGVVQKTINPWSVAERTGGALPQNINFAIKSDNVLEFIKTKSRPTFDKLIINQSSGFERIQAATVKVRSGIVPAELENKPKLVVRFEYTSIWDMWYRFKLFVVAVLDFDSHETLFVAGQGYDNMTSNEEVVIKDTLAKVKGELTKQ